MVIFKGDLVKYVWIYIKINNVIILIKIIVGYLVIYWIKKEFMTLFWFK